MALPRLWNWSLWLIWGLMQLKTDDCSQGEPAAQLLCRSMSEAFEEVTLTFQVTSEPFATGKKEIRGISLLLVNMKRAFKYWRVTGHHGGRAVNWEVLEFQGSKELKCKKACLSRSKVTLRRSMEENSREYGNTAAVRMGKWDEGKLVTHDFIDSKDLNRAWWPSSPTTLILEN